MYKGDGITIHPTNSLLLTRIGEGPVLGNRMPVLGMRGVEVREGSGERGYFEVHIIQSDRNSFIGLATHDGKHGYNFFYSLGWRRSGGIHGAGAGDVVGILVDCTKEPTLRFFVNGMQVHQQEFTQEGHGQVFYPAICLGNAQIFISSNPDLPTV